MLLVADIGNTSTTVGVYDNEKLINSWKIASDKKRSEDEYGVILSGFINHAELKSKLKGAIISSVVLPLTERFKTAIEKYLNVEVVVLSHKIDTGVKLAIEKPSEAGADRIANAYGAYKLYKGPAIVVDFGTATSFDIINEKGEFIGGVIAPGIRISAEALNAFTSKLPKVTIEAPEHAIGNNTVNAMLSGLVRGHAAMIDGLIAQCEKELGQKATIIATGGYSNIVTDCMTRPFDYLNPYLTLEGLRLLYELNKN